MKKSIILVFVFITAITLGQKKKVLLIGIDGLQFEQIATVNTPNFDTFTIKKGYNGGVFGTPSQQVTSSGPSWVTILTGVWTDVHGITSNSASQVSEASSVFKFIKSSNNKLTTASISTWKNINLLLYKDMYSVDFSTQGGTDEMSTELALNQLKNHAPDFTFIHLDDIDHAGHAVGFGVAYGKAIQKVDAQIGQLLRVIKKRESSNNEEWLVMLVTDHGRGLKGKNHGNQTLTEKTIFIGMNKKGTSFFEGIDNKKEVYSLKELETFIPQTAVVSTLLKYLNINIKKEWNLEANPLIE
ncbi:MAG: putative AlkP superfamily pyrophosphatase or phosphodiesterase [Polaribacter sp.]|jgi:predicted AlkP superfamily pyrophosphatase or phosphodiesterase